MFWTIVGALLFVFVGIPLIIMVLGWLGIGSISLLSYWSDRKEQRKADVVVNTHSNNSKKWWLIAFGGIAFIVILVVALNLEDDTSYVSNYNAPLTNTSTINTYQEQLNKNAGLEKQRYDDFITKVTGKFPDKKISTIDQNWISNNLPAGVNFYKLKPLLIADGFEFVGLEVGGNNSTSKDYSEEIATLVKQFKVDYPDLEINSYEELQLRKNIPSYITYTSVKDEMLKQGFKFK